MMSGKNLTIKMHNLVLHLLSFCMLWPESLDEIVIWTRIGISQSALASVCGNSVGTASAI